MPFGTKKDPSTGWGIDFDRIYETAIQPGIEAADLEPIRADEERTGGIIHKAMFERLMLCDYAIADLTTANANVFYELGIRHAVRPATTLAIFGGKQQIAFDVRFIRALFYSLGEGNRFGDNEAARLKHDLARRLNELKGLQKDQAVADSPVFQLLTDYAAPDIARLKTDVFRERARYAANVKNDLARARFQHDPEEMRRIQGSLGAPEGVEFGVLIDLFLSYRAVKEWQSMVDLYEAMPAALQGTVMVREQLGFAYNRLGRRDDALRVLEEILDERGMSSETCGLIGRVYKDRWVEAKDMGNTQLAESYLTHAIDMYKRGFEADPRDAYPGINALTLLDIKGDSQALEHKAEILPVVRFAVERRLKSSRPDYWDYATLLELAVLADDPAGARESLSQALSRVRESWEPETTANNLSLIQSARLDRGEDVSWISSIIEALKSSI
jgi:tetratricopeptide (TPR) repeat protein